jgi:hypothetical protein
MTKKYRVLTEWKRAHEKPSDLGYPILNAEDSHTLQVLSGQALINDEITVAECGELWDHTIIGGNTIPELIQLLKENGVFK